MAAKLKIVWDGQAPGLAQHRLSLNTFGGPLDKLRKAIKSIATNLVDNALVGSQPALEESARRARLRRSSPVDLQLTVLAAGSVGLEFECELMPNQVESLFVADLANKVVREFLESVRDESRGQLRNRHVNEYLRSLPTDKLTRHKYALMDGDRELDVVDVTKLALADVPENLPVLIRQVGQVTGISFEPGPNEVTVLLVESSTVRLSATKEQVEKAFTLRAADAVEFMAVTESGDKPRLLWIRRHGEPGPLATPEARTEHLISKWDETLRRLSK